MNQATHEVYALRYATLYGRQAKDLFARYDDFGIEDRELNMDCYFWLIRSDSQVVLVDCGWSREAGLTAGLGRLPTDFHDPLDLLAKVGVGPEKVDHVIVSHMHLDHIGNLGDFPNATVSVARAEFDCWTGRHGRNPAMAHATRSAEVELVRNLAEAGRVRFVDGEQEIFDGVTATVVGGHSPGQMILDVQTASGVVVLASDAIHYHEELARNMPFYVYTDLPAMLCGYDLLRARSRRANTWVVAGHDPCEMDRFTRVNADCIDLARPLRATTALRHVGTGSRQAMTLGGP